MKRLSINGKSIGAGERCYIVAEMSANHGQNFDTAVKIVETASESGADAIKLQTYTPDTMTINVNTDFFQIKDTIWKGRNLYDLYKDACTPWEWHPKLKKIADRLGLDFFSTPFDSTAVDFLQELDVPLYKVASFELIDLPLLRYIAKTGKPIIISTGMASLSEIEEAVNAVRAIGQNQLALLKCTSAYPAPTEEMNLRTIPILSKLFDVPVGLSDHSMTDTSSIIAVTLGACIIEKHLTLSRSVSGPDRDFSLEPQEFKLLVEAVRSAEKAVGEINFGAGKAESKSRIFRRSLFVVENMKKGQRFTNKTIRSIRPGHGLKPKYLEDVIGRYATRKIQAGTPLTWELVGGKSK